MESPSLAHCIAPLWGFLLETKRWISYLLGKAIVLCAAPLFVEENPLAPSKGQMLFGKNSVTVVLNMRSGHLRTLKPKSFWSASSYLIWLVFTRLSKRIGQHNNVHTETKHFLLVWTQPSVPAETPQMTFKPISDLCPQSLNCCILTSYSDMNSSSAGLSPKLSQLRDLFWEQLF